MAETSPPLFSYPEITAREDDYLRRRRARVMDEAYAARLDENRFGIALSGGGIRAATISLGLLKTLNKFSILQQADYLSSVSGGGYTGAYIQGTLQADGSYETLFSESHVSYLRNRGEYLFPGTGWTRVWNQLTLVVAYFVSLLMSLIGPAIVAAMFLGVYGLIEEVIDTDLTRSGQLAQAIYYYGTLTMAVIIAVHYLFNTIFVYNLYVSAWYNRLEAGIIVAAFALLLVAFVMGFRGLEAVEWQRLLLLLLAGVALLLFGLVTNPNATSFHRFYRKQLADAFLYFSGDYRNALLQNLTEQEGQPAPYPLINTTLNLQASRDPHFQGSKASDYFLLSPLYCGAKLTGYVPTAEATGYRNLTLPAAVTISAAAVNPGMGAYSSRLLSIATTLLNLRLGFWMWNPRRLHDSFPLVWWPSYFFYELFGTIGTDKKMVNISDGGHIENLGVMELLRRRCRLIIAVDATADPFYTFPDLEILTIRARNELGIDIRFREDQVPEDVIRPRPSHGYSHRRYAVADLYQLWEKTEINGEEVIEHYQNRRVGILVYVKSSVTAPVGRPEIPREDALRYGTYKYKIYHPEFPHESTADQFFDPIQWESYYQLGQYLGADMLGLERLDDRDGICARIVTTDELIDYFDKGTEIFLPLEPPAAHERGLDVEASLTAGVPVEYKM